MVFCSLCAAEKGSSTVQKPTQSYDETDSLDQLFSETQVGPVGIAIAIASFSILIVCSGVIMLITENLYFELFCGSLALVFILLIAILLHRWNPERTESLDSEMHLLA